MPNPYTAPTSSPGREAKPSPRPGGKRPGTPPKDKKPSGDGKHHGKQRQAAEPPALVRQSSQVRPGRQPAFWGRPAPAGALTPAAPPHPHPPVQQAAWPLAHGQAS
jgi:hypothetical protein